MTITYLPTAPASSDPSTFEGRVDALLVALPTFVSEVNAQVAAAGYTFTALPSSPSLSDPTNFATDTAALFAALETFITQINAQSPGALTALPTLPATSMTSSAFTAAADAVMAAMATLCDEINLLFLLTVDAADFDGTNDYMLRGADLTGNADSKSGIFSGWINFAGSDGGAQPRRILGNSTAGHFYVGKSTTNAAVIWGSTSTPTNILRMRSATDSILSGSGWHHILASWDLSTASGHLYLDDVSNLDAGTKLLTDDTIDYTQSDFSVGADTAGTASTIFDGDLAEIYFAPGQYLDFSIESNRRKFISSTGKPVDLGSDGSGPTGVAPIIYLHLDDAEAVANFATNAGSGGNFSITGTLATASTSPSD